MSAEYPDELRPDVANLGEPLLPSRGNPVSIHRGVSVAFSGSSSRRFNSSAWRLSDPALSWAARCLLPDSGCLRAWALLTTALAYFTAVEGPFAIAFRHRLTPVQLATDAVFCADTVLQFFKPRVQGGTYVTQPARVAWSYLTTGFLLDALAALPWDRIAGATYGSSETALACGLLRLLRLRRCFALMADMERNINLNYHTAVLFRLLSILLIIAHWEACGFWYLAYAHKFDDTTWTFHFGEYRPGQTIWDHYLSALYWTFTTMSTTGYGDLVPVNDDERVYTLCIMVLNIGLTAYIVGNMTVLATKDDSSSLEYRGVMSQLKAYMQHKGIGEDLKAMAVQHLKLKREMQVERDDVLDHCAPYIRNRILASLYKSRLASCALFQGASESFVDAISQAAYMEFVFPDSWLLNAGERSSHLYCIISGTVEVLNKDGARLWGICEGATIGDETALCDFPMAYSYHSVTLVKTLVVPVTVLRQACNQNKLSHRMACFNMQSCLRSIDSVLEPDVAERIRQVSSYITARRTDLVTKLCYAASTNDLAYMKQLLNSDPEHDINLGDYDGRRPIHIAAAYGRIAILKHLINDLNADVNSKDAMGGSPLLDSVKQGHRKAAEFLREVGAELGLEDSASVLCNAVFREKADLLQLYLDFGADPNGGDYDLRTPLHIACAEGLLPMVKILVAHGANLHARDRWMETPLQEAEKSPSQLTVASYLAEVLQQQQWQLQGEARGRDALVSAEGKTPH